MTGHLLLVPEAHAFASGPSQAHPGDGRDQSTVSFWSARWPHAPYGLGAVAPIEVDQRIRKPVLLDALVDEVRAAVEELTAAYPLYPDLVV